MTIAFGGRYFGGFDWDADRLFMVGDLIDRGPDSAQVLEFLAIPNVYFVRGNHDNRLVTLSLDDLKILGSTDWNGMGWICTCSDPTLLAIQVALSKLPFAIEIDTPRGSVGVIHAEVPIGMDWSTFIGKLEAGDNECLVSALEGRTRSDQRDMSGVAGIDRLFVGHTIQWEGIQQSGNIFSIDTGAVFQELGKNMGSLTMANLLCRSTVLTQHETFPQASVAGSDPADLSDTPFGRYAAQG